MKTYAALTLAMVVAVLSIQAWLGDAVTTNGDEGGGAAFGRLEALEAGDTGLFSPSLQQNAALLPLAPPQQQAPEKTHLGQRLFFDKRLSRDNSISCATCHNLQQGGVDSLPTSIGVDGAIGPINAPTVFNSSLNFAQFWDGRAATLEEQAAGPVHNPLEMASSWPQVIAKLKQDPHYVRDFAAVYPQGMTGETIADAIAAFERTLLTPNSRLDRYLFGEATALSKLELEGYRKFIDYGCAACHQGANIGGNMFQLFGVMGDYFADREPSQADLGRFNVTGRAEDKHVFKVPGLRNVALTAPYFHDASAATLDEAVAVMARYQLGRDLADNDVKAISAFLKTLTGKWRGQPSAP